MVRFNTRSSLDGQLEVMSPQPDLIAAILVSWVSLILVLCMIKLLMDLNARLKIAL